MNRPAIFEHLVRLEGANEVMRWFIANEPDDDAVRIELDARCAQIETRLAQIRGALSESSRASNVHPIANHVTDHRGDAA